VRDFHNQALADADQMAQPPAGARAAAPPPPPAFRYAGLPIRDHRGAIAGSPGAGVAANRQINEDYHNLNGAMQSFLGGDPNGPALPQVSDWMTFGKYASREAGEQIRQLENILRTLQGNPIAGAASLVGLFQGNSLAQAYLMASDEAGRNVNLAAWGPGVFAGGVALNMVATMATMRQAMVRGNTEIHNNIAPAYDAFLRAEAREPGSGMAGLRAAGYTPGGEKDRQGWVTQAFESYGRARELGLQAQRLPAGAERDRLLAQRQEATERANLLLGFQEQHNILQQPSIFGNPRMQNALNSISGTMTLTDANGTHNLLPGGGNWSDFETRMGLQRVPAGTAGAITLRQPDGTVIHYSVPRPPQRGTISEYFLNNSTGGGAQNLTGQRARPIADPAALSLPQLLAPALAAPLANPFVQDVMQGMLWGPFGRLLR